MPFTPSELTRVVPSVKLANAELYVPSLINAMREFVILAPKCQAAFVAQCLHESGYFSAVRENLNYSEQALAAMPKYFTSAQAAQYARKPEMIANRMYANRMGNGPESSGDGWRFRGAGLIQITGRYNFTNCGKALCYDLVSNPEYLTTPAGAARSAGWFWSTNNLNTPALRGDIDEVSRIINAGPAGNIKNVKGLEARRQLYNTVLSLF